MNLYFEYFYCEDEQRRSEFDFCIQSNINSKLFKNINAVVPCGKIPLYLLEAEKRNEITLHFDKSNILQLEDGIFVNSDQKRTTFQQIFDLSDISTQDKDINIVCNLDIWFDDSINLLQGRINQDIAIGLSRWYPEDDHYMVTGCHMDGKAAPGSNDVWAWVGKCKVKNGDFFLGYTACDCRIMKCFEEAGYRVYNPAKSIKTWHKHKGRGPTPPEVPGPYWKSPSDHHSIEDVK